MSNNFTAPVDIANRALQRVGAKRIQALTDPTKNAKEVAFCYDKLRRAELRRNVWRFAVRRTILRGVGTALQPWVSTNTYASGAYVSENGVNYVSVVNGNIGNDPGLDNGSHWTVFLGNTSLQVTYTAWSNATAYLAFQVAVGTDNLIYQCLAGNTNVNPVGDTTGTWILFFGNYVASQYDSTQEYSTGELVFYTINNNVYMCTTNGNANDPTSANSGWVQMICTAAPIVVAWPAGTGPATEPLTKNVFVLPIGFLRQAPTDPSAGRTSFLGYPSNLPSTDWVLEGPFMLSMDAGPLMYRYVADIMDVTKMDDLFCEGLAARIALEVCEPLTQSTSKLQAIGSEYKQFMGDARNVNGIETGATPPPLDDYILVRL